MSLYLYLQRNGLIIAGVVAATLLQIIRIGYEVAKAPHSTSIAGWKLIIEPDPSLMLSKMRIGLALLIGTICLVVGNRQIRSVFVLALLWAEAEFVIHWIKTYKIVSSAEDIGSSALQPYASFLIDLCIFLLVTALLAIEVKSMVSSFEVKNQRGRSL